MVTEQLQVAMSRVCSLVIAFLLDCDVHMQEYDPPARFQCLKDATVTIARLTQVCRGCGDAQHQKLEEKIYFIQVHRYTLHTHILKALVDQMAISESMSIALWNVAEEMTPHAGTLLLLSAQMEYQAIQTPRRIALPA